MFKTRLDVLGTILGVFGFLKTLKKHFENSMEHWAKKNFRKKYPKTCSKHNWTLLGTILGIFGILKKFLFIKNISKTRPGTEDWAKKKFSKKVPSKLVQNTFEHFWERFWAFLDFWNFFDFLKTFRSLDPPWNTGQKMFTKKLPQNMFKTRLDNLGTILGLFGMLKVFFKKKAFRRLDSPRNNGQKKFFEKTTPKHVQNKFRQVGNDFGHFWKYENFSIL